MQETKLKGYVNIKGYRVIADKDINPGKFGFGIHHASEKSYFFSSENQIVIREWMKALKKATISRDYRSTCLHGPCRSTRLIVISMQSRSFRRLTSPPSLLPLRKR